MQRVRDLPHMGKVRELESRRHEVEELIRHDLLPGELHPTVPRIAVPPYYSITSSASTSKLCGTARQAPRRF